MARMRVLKPGFFRNEELGALSFAHRLAFAGLWTVADREGRLEGPPSPCVRLVLEVPHAVPASLNKFAGRSRWAYRGEKARWYGRLSDAWLLALAEQPKVVRSWPRPPVGRVRVTVERITPREGALDPDNAAGACKPLLDALRALQLLADDTARAIDLVVRQPKGQPRQRLTRITLELL